MAMSPMRSRFSPPDLEVLQRVRDVQLLAQRQDGVEEGLERRRQAAIGREPTDLAFDRVAVGEPAHRA
jgi:hypothetical protein